MDNLKGKTVSLAHGAGGKQTSELIDQVLSTFCQSRTDK